jgi:hypothetical protein
MSFFLSRFPFFHCCHQKMIPLFLILFSGGDTFTLNKTLLILPSRHKGAWAGLLYCLPQENYKRAAGKSPYITFKAGPSVAPITSRTAAPSSGPTATLTGRRKTTPTASPSTLPTGSPTEFPTSAPSVHDEPPSLNQAVRKLIVVSLPPVLRVFITSPYWINQAVRRSIVVSLPPVLESTEP